jgi:putative ABC transport system substrate-binding protein
VRRVAVALIAFGVLAVPLAAGAQPTGKVYRVGFLDGGSAPSSAPSFVSLIRDALGVLGYVEGQNLAIEARYADAKLGRLPTLAAELVRLKVDLMMARGTPAALAAKRVTATIPIVFSLSADPVQQGLIASLARPGGNLTGFAFGLYEDKQLELFKQAVPKLSHVACLCGGDPASWSYLTEAARRLGLRLRLLNVRGPTDLDSAITTAASGPAGGLLVPDTQWIGSQLERIADLAAKQKVPAVGFFRGFAEAGGLLSYGPKPLQHVSRLAEYVDRIFKGAKPADLPIEQPTKFELVINLKTAKALGLTIPQSMLARADEVIACPDKAGASSGC